MSTGTKIRFLFSVVVAAGAWGFLSHLGSGMNAVRDDLLGRTRFLIRRARSGDAETRARLTARYAPPDGDAAQKAQIERLWTVLREGDPGTVAYGQPSFTTTAASHPQRRVDVQSRTEEGRPATVSLNWVQIQGTWYLSGYTMGKSASPAPS